MKNVHVHVHGQLNGTLARSSVVDDDDRNYKRDQQGRFATSSGTGEQHAATAELHTSLAARKGTDHPHHAMHVAAAEAHTEAAGFLAQANKAQHPGAALAAEHAAKKARTHENLINKGRGSTPGNEVKAQNKAMSDPRVAKGNKERMDDLDAKHKKPKGAKAAVKDAASCGCGGHTADVLFIDAMTLDDWAKWNAEHKERAMRHQSVVDNKLVGKAQTELHAKAHAAHQMAHHAIENGKHELASEHAKNAAEHEAELKKKHGYLPKPIVHEHEAKAPRELKPWPKGKPHVKSSRPSGWPT